MQKHYLIYEALEDERSVYVKVGAGWAFFSIGRNLITAPGIAYAELKVAENHTINTFGEAPSSLGAPLCWLGPDGLVSRDNYRESFIRFYKEKKDRR
jgi:hypothetical protein